MQGQIMFKIKQQNVKTNLTTLITKMAVARLKFLPENGGHHSRHYEKIIYRFDVIQIHYIYDFSSTNIQSYMIVRTSYLAYLSD